MKRHKNDDIRVEPRLLQGSLSAIPSKSDAHRQFICAALSESSSTVRLGTQELGDDIRVTIECLRNLGAEIMEISAGNWLVQPLSKGIKEKRMIDCGESGSTLRFLLPVLGALGAPTAVHGKGRLPDRPLSPLKEQLMMHGCSFSNEKLPFTISGQLTSGSFVLPGNVSSQYISGLLFALPLLAEDSMIRLTTPLESADYVAMTIRTLRQFGIKVVETEGGFSVPGSQTFRSLGVIETEGDWSSAAFFLTAGALGKGISISGLAEDSNQPDRAIVEFLQKFGADVACQNAKIRVVSEIARALTIDASAAPDLVPILSILACAAHGETKIINAERLRLKESDRLLAMCNCINALGGEAALTSDGMTINGTGRLRGGTVDGQNDHRIVMSAAIASMLCSEPVVIQGASAVRKSYPEFWEHFQHLGGEIHVL